MGEAEGQLGRPIEAEELPGINDARQKTALTAALALQENSMNNAEITKAVVKVGAGRGFIIQSGHNRLVITAAHCLPHLPPCHGASNTEGRTYPKLLGPLGSHKPKVWAECLFADPVGDIAVLGSSDGSGTTGRGRRL